jgi:glycosyltransferase involved in cell wall biosynthesis
MKIAHVNDNDLLSNRFNGHDMQIELNKRGISAKQFVARKIGDNPNTLLLTKEPWDPVMRYLCIGYESNTSINAMVHPYGWRLLNHIEFQKSDVVHYHLIHNHLLSYAMFPLLTKAKPSVITVHDPYLFTGHCIYPPRCDNWKTGCCDCPDLGIHYPMKRDRAGFMWNVKRSVFAKIDIDIVVASDYMMKMVKESPITSHLQNVHKIPFGIDIDLFSSTGSRKDVRDKLGIPQDHFALFFRADYSAYKGYDVIKNMLDILKQKKPVTLLVVGDGELLDEYSSKYNIKRYGWVSDNNLMAELYCACDVFLMPSHAEAFGMMAIEAMASERPVIVLDGTSLPYVTFAPDCGISIPGENAPQEMAQVIERLMENPGECIERGRKGRKLAEQHYRFEDYVNKHVKLYEEILSRDK